MNLNTETLSDTRSKVVVTLTADEVKTEERTVVREITQHAKVPGFRAGKVPEPMLRRRFARQIQEELNRKCVSKAYKYAVDESGIKAYGLVDVSNQDIALGQDNEIVFTFDLQPEFELPSYEGIETRVPPISVTDEQVEKEVQNILRSRSQFEQVEREAQAGDYVKLTYTGEVDGQPIAEIAPEAKIWGTQENTWEEAGVTGPDALGVPAVVEGIVGLKAGDQKEVTQEFGADHAVEALRGKTGTYKIEVFEVRERKAPELNEELFKSLGVDSEEDLRKKIHEAIEGTAKRDRRVRQRQQILDYLTQSVDFPLPESAIDNETEKVIERIMRENLQRGVAQEEFEKNKDALHQQARVIAQQQLKRDFILGRIAEKEDVKVTDEDLSRVVYAQSQRFRIPFQELVKDLRKDKDAIRALQRNVALDKTLEIIADKANLVETEDAPEVVDEAAQPAS